MELEHVQSSYARWAPIYDRTFGAATHAGRQRAVRFVNDHGGAVLEVGVGTGLSLPLYGPNVTVTGIDFSREMLDKARRRVAALELGNVAALRRMDAREMDFPDQSFDIVVAMHVLSVVPEPARVMAQIARVCRPGGHVVITNHFARERGAMAVLERALAPLESLIGWHSDFEIGTILQEPSLKVARREELPPLGLMTFLVLRKDG
ncbi:MAG TPA: class I SAM-dependent methyltransferase [Thermopetrobacter sp.]|nr:class I SAM-dependent methyltransferase [Thermopetrobacter sp.]